MAPPFLSCGLDFTCVPDITECMKEIGEGSFKFLTLPIVHPRYRREHIAGAPVKHGFTRADLLLSTQDWNIKIVGKVSTYLDVDSSVEKVQRRYEDILLEELAYCRGLGLTAIVLELRTDACINLARIITNHFAQGSVNPSLIWVVVSGDDVGWRRWSRLHELLGWDNRVGIALRLPADLPDSNILRRWFGEPVKCVILQTTLFRTNKRGYPVLGRSHAMLVARMTQRGVQAMVCGARRYQPFNYYQYLNHIHCTYDTKDQQFQSYDRNTIVSMEGYAKGWEDYIQMPLQPLSDNLDAITYNVFETDPVKYNKYQAAITEILRDFKENGFREPEVTIPLGITVKFSQSTRPLKQTNEVLENGLDNCAEVEEKQGKSIGSEESPVVVMVLGAGRGPLVRAVLNAAELTETIVKVYAVEKNPCAIVSLIAQAKELWKDQVTVLAGDMRRLSPPEPAHLIISELLGSWGDNELSPECLWGARSLVARGGRSIPLRYVSYLAPLHSPILWNSSSTHKLGTLGNVLTGGHTVYDGLQAIWVVFMRNKFDIAEPKPAFSFEHLPETGSNDPTLEDSRRKVNLEWNVEQSCVLHGFSGYFHADLTEKVNISILPKSHSSGMISWFPVFIPIKTPFRVAPGDVIRADFWRCCDHSRVWYEWIVAVETKGPSGQSWIRSTIVHNSNGRISHMNL